MTRPCRVHSLVVTVASVFYGLGVMGCNMRQSRSGEADELVDTQGNVAKLAVTSPAFENGGSYPVEFTCDGAGVSPPIKWSGAPAETKSYALQLWHVPKDGETKSYWVVYNIPADAMSLRRIPRASARTATTAKRKPAMIQCAPRDRASRNTISPFMPCPRNRSLQTKR